MTTALKRVEDAITFCLTGEPGRPVQMDIETLARAVIAAMREPDKAMLHAACKAMSPGRRPTPDHVPVKEKHRIRYQAMIDAALGEAK